MTDTKEKTYPADPRGGLFIDFGDERGRVHESELTPADRAKAGLPAIETPATPTATPTEAEVSASPTVRQTDNG